MKVVTMSLYVKFVFIVFIASNTGEWILEDDVLLFFFFIMIMTIVLIWIPKTQ